MTAFPMIAPFATPAAVGDAQLPDEATAYWAKLRRSGRPRALTSAFLLLVLAALRAAHFQARGPRLSGPGMLTSECLALANAVTAYVTRAVGPGADARLLARRLDQHIHDYTQKALDALPADEVASRIALIVVAETQLATVAAVRAAAGVLTVIRRETTSVNPCDQCEQLARDYEHPFPEEMWWVHPRCACEFTRIAS